MCTNEDFYALKKDNTHIRFYSYNELLKWLSGNFMWGRKWWNHRDFKRIEQCGNNWNDTYMRSGQEGVDLFWWMSQRVPVEYIIYDYTGKVINVEYLRNDINDFVPKPRDSTYWWCSPSRAMWYRNQDNYIFRCDPVPGTGQKKWKFKNFYKTANCLQERRLYGDPHHRIYGRGKRYPCNLPNSWDDNTQSRVFNKKSWKKAKKKKQWMKREDNMPGSMDGFSPSSKNAVKMDPASSPKKFNINVSETKVKGEDYTRPAMDDSQTDDDNLRHDKGDGYMDMRSQLDYPNVGEIADNAKNPMKTTGQPGIREHLDSFTDTGLPPEGIKVFEDETPVVVDDSKKHGPLLKWQFRRDDRGRTGPA